MILRGVYLFFLSGILVVENELQGGEKNNTGCLNFLYFKKFGAVLFFSGEL
jgi:hypothetical protein